MEFFFLIVFTLMYLLTAENNNDIFLFHSSYNVKNIEEKQR